ncbi:MAG: signal recognition particle-docking protein FtsY [Clostridiales bacterium]|nr:signal recognition particle-docking protein FtsY [Clostridiales bacterium]MBS5877113.1 signal recognition particle-docking protein FtsY [Clostridiales bacterium]
MGFFQKLKEGLAKTRQNIVAGFDGIFSSHKLINDDFYDELEEVMIMGDMGVRATDEILDELKVKVKENKIKDPAECRQLLIDTIKEKIDLGENAYDYENRRSTLLVIGVNGVGKTTSVGKLAAAFHAKGKNVLLAAADTFRAGAIEQLKIWGQRAKVDVIAQAEGADPAAVIYDSVQAAKARNVDILIADTAGRLHNKKNLMNELSKIDRVITREYPGCYRETLIVLDATTGQNAIQQLREFNEVAEITGIILTKMDGTAKGGIVVAIQAEFGIPVKYIGVGEKIEDLQKFDSDSFVNALFEVDIDEKDESEIDDILGNVSIEAFNDMDETDTAEEVIITEETEEKPSAGEETDIEPLTDVKLEAESDEVQEVETLESEKVSESINSGLEENEEILDNAKNDIGDSINTDETLQFEASEEGASDAEPEEPKKKKWGLFNRWRKK